MYRRALEMTKRLRRLPAGPQPWVHGGVGQTIAVAARRWRKVRAPQARSRR